MALVKRVVLVEGVTRVCEKCKKPINTEAVKDRRPRYKITPAKKDKDGNVIKGKQIKHLDAPLKYYHVDCFGVSK